MSKNATKVFCAMLAGLIIISGLPVKKADASFLPGGAVGPVAPTGGLYEGFPYWYQDQDGLRLDLMEAADQFSISDPIPLPLGTNPFAEQIGFNAEGFWWSADASFDNGTQTGLLVLAVEAVFGGEAAVDGEQSAFGRLRIRIDGLTPNTEYTVRHPYGTDTFTSDAAGVINEPGGDIGCIAQPGIFSCDQVTAPNFSTLLSSQVGPFLTWDTFDPNPANTDPLLINNQPQYANRVYVGNPNFEHVITGSPVAQNFFRVEGPGLPGGFILQPLFTVSGRFFSPVVTVNTLATNDATPALTGAINDTTATISVTVDGQTFAGTNNADGTWSATVPNPLADGIFDVEVSATPTSGGVGTDSTTNELTIDTTAPALPVVNSIAGNNFINNSEKGAIIVAGTAEANALVNVTLSDGTNSVSGSHQLSSGATAYAVTLNGTAAAPAALADGTITPSVTATDAATNVSVAAVTPTATQDTVAPIVSGVVNGTSYPSSVTPTFNEGTATLDGNAFTSGTSVDAQGSYTLIVADAAGNSTTVAFSISPNSPIYRFWSDTKQGHFFTSSAAEKDSIIATYPDDVWHFEGTAFNAFNTQLPGTTPIYRFWSDTKQHHFYTASAAEKDSVIATYPDNVWHFEGIAYYAYADQQPSTTAVYRFWSDTKQGHFFTSSAAEKDSVIATYPDDVWHFEGIAWYVPTN